MTDPKHTSESTPLPHAFSKDERDALYRALAERRDMRHFNGEPLDEVVFKRILSAAHLAPSVGLMQPWRFIRVQSQQLKEQIHALVDQERLKTADAIDEQTGSSQQNKAQFLALKVEGVLQCSEVLVACLPDAQTREQFIFGRRTLPEMDLASLSCAIQNMWLAARVEGVGLGWVSIFEPEQLAALLNLPEGAKAVAILCLGPVDAFYDKPMLIEEGWAEAKPLSDFLYTDTWPE